MGGRPGQPRHMRRGRMRGPCGRKGCVVVGVWVCGCVGVGVRAGGPDSLGADTREKAGEQRKGGTAARADDERLQHAVAAQRGGEACGAGRPDAGPREVEDPQEAVAFERGGERGRAAVADWVVLKEQLLQLRGGGVFGGARGSGWKAASKRCGQGGRAVGADAVEAEVEDTEGGAACEGAGKVAAPFVTTQVVREVESVHFGVPEQPRRKVADARAGDVVAGQAEGSDSAGPVGQRPPQSLERSFINI
jgi:hypothetical protein